MTASFPGACNIPHTPPEAPRHAESETRTGLLGTDERFQLLFVGPPGRNGVWGKVKMMTLRAPANSGAARSPRDPGGPSHHSRAATAPTRGHLEGRTLPVLRSAPTLALARAARAGTHPGLFPSTHMFSHTHSLESTRLWSGWEPRLKSHWLGTKLQSRYTLAPFSRLPAKSACPYSPPGYTP